MRSSYPRVTGHVYSAVTSAVGNPADRATRADYRCHMKLAILGVIAVGVGIGLGTDGLVYAGALWIVGGIVLRLVVGSKRDLELEDAAGATFSDAFGGRRGAGTAWAILVGGASIAIGLVPLGFESDDAWRWAPVAIGGLMAGLQVLALLMFSAGSGLQSLTGHVGSPDHPAEITLDAVAETGTYINERPRLELELTVRPDGRPSYTVTIKQVVGHAELGSLRPGTTYRGLVDLDRPDGVKVEWHQPIEDVAPTAPTTTSSDDVAQRLARVDDLLARGVITPDEHATTRREILDDL